MSKFRKELERILNNAMPTRNGKQESRDISLNDEICRCLLACPNAKGVISIRDVSDFLGLVLDSNRYSGNLDFEIDDV